jgi:phosphohistidine phosphatase
MSARRWIMIRHAEAEPFSAVAGPDHERRLSPHGRVQARELGARLRQEGLMPDHVLCSTALRARQTMDGAFGAKEGDPGVEVTEELYHADLDDVFDLVSRIAPEVATLALIGHNPNVARLYEAFPGADGEPHAPTAFPAGAAAVVDVIVEWLYAAPGTGTARLL